jgi:AraC family transcriptional activator of pobA
LVIKNSKYRHIGLQVYIFENFASISAFNELLMADYFSILMVNSGSLSIKINNNEVTVFENELLVVPIRSSCNILIMSDQLKIYLLSFTPEFVFENCIRRQHIGYLDFYIKKLPSKMSVKNKDVRNLIFLFELLYRKTRRSSKQIFKEEVLLFTFNLLVYELAGKYSKHFQQLNGNYSIKEKLLMQFLKILNMNCRKQHGVKYYADVLSMTPDNLTKIIKELTEKNAKQFIVEAIVLEAKNLLQNEGLSISNIREELHFSNSSFFSNFFKRHTSLSPTEYRLRLNSH